MAERFPYNLPPMAHQRAALRKSAGAEAFALLMKQGTGKTFVAVVDAAALYLDGKIDGLLVIAPHGVHTMWARDEIPKHTPGFIPYRIFAWDSGRAGTKIYKAALREFLESRAPYKALCVNIDALRNTECWKTVMKFVRERRCYGVVDESKDIASPSSERGRLTRRLRRFLPYRRILSGTASEESPFDLYGQFAFLSPGIIGARTFREMKETYAEWERVDLYRPEGEEAIGGKERFYMKLKEYKNLDALARRIAPFSFRVTKEEALPDLPPKLFTKWYFDLTKETRQVYDTLRSEFLVELGGGREIEAGLVVTRMLRLQQIACGYVPVSAMWSVGEEDPEVNPIYSLPGRNARVEALKEAMERYRGPSLVWCRFAADEEKVREMLEGEGISYVQYKGNNTERHDAVSLFQDGKAQVFLSNARRGGRGLTLHRAEYVFNYSTYYSLDVLDQCQDRAHRIGLTHPVLYVDIIGTDTVDEHLVKVRERKQELANLIYKNLDVEAWL